MYIVKCGDSKFEVPNNNLRFLTISKAMELKKNVKLDTNKDAISFLQLLGCEVFEDA